MALRVLLADESSTIKKVFQLALQDFAVEVRPVNIGVDVVPVAQTFNPDIIFADVLLQKKSGYDVSAEVKQNAALKHIPVVLMWSGFMELDEDKFQASLANARLEKPFDVTALRKLITDLVPRTQNQRLSQFLTFPKMPDLEEKAPAAAQPEENPDLLAPEEEDFRQISIPKMKGAQNEKFRLNLRPEELDSQDLPVNYQVPESTQAKPVDLNDDKSDREEFSFRDNRRDDTGAENDDDDEVIELDDFAMPEVPTPGKVAAAPAAMSAEEIERIIRAQSAEVIESVVWKIVPDLAAQIIERELHKLLNERDAHP